MNEKLLGKVEELFQGAPRTRRANELKEEVMANLTDKYNDLISSGRSEDEAVRISLDGIGDVEELIRGLKENDVFNYEQIKKDRQKHAFNMAVAIGMYIFGVVVLIVCTEGLQLNDSVGVSLMLTIDAAATGLIVYNALSRPKYIREDNTMVEEFKEWKSAATKKKKVLQSIKSVVWTLIVALYLLISFLFSSWAYSWIIFIIGIAIEKIITLTFELKE